MGYAKLWKEFIKGNKKALALVFQGFYEELFNYGKKLTGSKNLAEDGLQDLFLKLWINREKLPEIDNHKAYLFTSLRNLLIDSLRWQSRFLNILEINGNDLFEIEFSIEDILIRKQVDMEVREKLLDAMNKLSSRQKEAIYLRFFEGLEFETISSIMEINIQSVRNSIHRGIMALREIELN